MVVSRRLLCVFLMILFVVATLLVANGGNVIYAIAFSIWLIGILYSINDIYNRGMLFVFLISFFGFLMGRDFLEQFFAYNVEDIPVEILNHTYILLILSLSSIIIGYIFFARKNEHTLCKKVQITNRLKDNCIRDISKIIYYLSIVFALLSKAVTVFYVFKNGYASYYLGFHEFLNANPLLYVVSKLELIMPAALCVYFSTLPSKKDYRKAVGLYVFYLLLSLGTGQRSTTILGILLLLVYNLYRKGLQSQHFYIKRKFIVWLIVGVPLLFAGLAIYSDLRFNKKTKSDGVLSYVPKFIYAQGVSSNIIKRAYELEAEIPPQNYTLEFTHSGLLAILLGNKVYHGNSVEHAKYGGSFTHSLGYVVMGNSYLSGRGTGSSFLAELYYDFGYIGVVLGSLLYSFLISRIATVRPRMTVFGSSVLLYIITPLLWAPRASFSGFLSLLLAPSVLFVFLFIFFGAGILNSMIHRCKRHV